MTECSDAIWVGVGIGVITGIIVARIPQFIDWLLDRIKYYRR